MRYAGQSIRIFGVVGIPEVNAGDKLGRMIADAAAAQGDGLEDGDILIVTQKIVSKAEGRVVPLASVTPSEFAVTFASHTGRDARLVELVLRESKSIVRMDPERGVIIAETHHGFVCANAGIDQSNVPGDEVACLLPVDCDESARRVMDDVRAASGVSDAGDNLGHVRAGVAGWSRQLRRGRGGHESGDGLSRASRRAGARDARYDDSCRGRVGGGGGARAIQGDRRAGVRSSRLPLRAGDGGIAGNRAAAAGAGAGYV